MLFVTDKYKADYGESVARANSTFDYHRKYDEDIYYQKQHENADEDCKKQYIDMINIIDKDEKIYLESVEYANIAYDE